MRNNRNVSGMNRTGFVQAVGAGVAGMAGAAMMGSGVVSALGMEETNKVLIIHSGYLNAANLAQKVFYEAGIESDMYVNTGSSASIVTELSKGYSAVLGINTSSNSLKISSAISELQSPINYVESFGTADDLNTGYFHRTAVTSSMWGYTAAREANRIFPAVPNVAFIRRIEESDFGGAMTPDSFGLQAKKGFDSFFGTDSFDIVINKTGTMYMIGGTVYCDGCISDLNNSPLGTGVWLIGSALDGSNAVNVVMNMRSLNNNENIYLTTTGTVGSNIINYEVTENGETTKPALEFMKTNGVGLHAHYDATSEAYQVFLDWAGMSDPDPTGSLDHRLMRATDAAMLLTAGLRHGNTQSEWYFGVDMASSPPGNVFFPGEVHKTRRANSAVDLLDYHGASGPVDMIKGEPRIGYFKFWAAADGSTGTVIWSSPL